MFVDDYRLVFSGRQDKKGTEGVALCIRKVLADSLISYQAISSRLLKARFKVCGGRMLSIIVCYAPIEDAPEDDKDLFYQQFSACIDSVASHDFLVVLGDMNARVGSDRDNWPGVIGPFGGVETSKNGDRLLTCCSGHGLSVMGTWFQHKDIHLYTWTHPSGASHAQIDHVLVRQFHRRDVLDVRVYRGADVSAQGVGGHFLVIAKIRKNLVREYKAKRPLRICQERLKIAAVKDSYSSAIEEAWLRVEGSDVASVEDEWKMFSSCIRCCAEKILGRSRTKARDTWISDETLRLTARKKELKNKMLQATGQFLEQQRHEFSCLLKTVRKSCLSDKEAWWSKKAQEVERSAVDGRLKDTFGILKQLSLKPGRPCSTLKGRDGRVLENEEQIIARWTEHFRDVLKADANVYEEDWSGMNSSTILEELVCRITFEEVVQAVQRTSKGKACGLDEITVEMLQSRPCLLWLFRVVRAVWETGIVPKDWIDAIAIPIFKGKGSPSDCDNYRGIMLLSVPGKIYARILTARLTRFAESRLAENQNGFRQGRSCTDAIFAVRRLMELSLEQQQQLWIVFVDFAKAYDSVVRGRLWNVLKSFGVPELFISRVYALHRNTSVKVRIGGLLGKEFQTKLGLRQGCVMAPVLFNIYLDYVMKQLPMRTGIKVDVLTRNDLVVPNSFRLKTDQSIVIHDTRFADDIALLSESSEYMSSDVDDMNKTRLPYNLHISVGKTKVMHVGKSPDACKCGIGIGDGKDFEIVDKCCYLGSMVASDGSISEETKGGLACLWHRFSR